jgi:5-methylcytosine-specific restriction endonuclease McrA
MVCGKPASKRSKVFCSNECKNSWWGSHDWSWVRNEILNRDSYKCAHCGLQLKRAESHYFEVISDPLGFTKTDHDLGERGYIYLPLIVDHIHPIALGGGEFDKANLQVLCKWCNKIKTKNDIGNIAQSKRFEKVVGKGRDLSWYS